MDTGRYQLCFGFGMDTGRYRLCCGFILVTGFYRECKGFVSGSGTSFVLYGFPPFPDVYLVLSVLRHRMLEDSTICGRRLLVLVTARRRNA